jgi:hypothetical protein
MTATQHLAKIENLKSIAGRLAWIDERAARGARADVERARQEYWAAFPGERPRGRFSCEAIYGA